GLRAVAPVGIERHSALFAVHYLHAVHGNNPVVDRRVVAEVDSKRARLVNLQVPGGGCRVDYPLCGLDRNNGATGRYGLPIGVGKVPTTSAPPHSLTLVNVVRLPGPRGHPHQIRLGRDVRGVTAVPRAIRVAELARVAVDAPLPSAHVRDGG